MSHAVLTRSSLVGGTEPHSCLAARDWNCRRFRAGGRASHQRGWHAVTNECLRWEYRDKSCSGGIAMIEAAVLARQESLCLAAVVLFSCSGALIMQMPRAERRTLFIFPIFLSVVVGGSLTVYGIENFSLWKFAGAALIPIAFVQAMRRVAPGWPMTALSYMTMIAGVVCADLLLEASVFR